MSEQSVADLVSKLGQIDKSTFDGNESARLLVLNEARLLVSRLQQPHELVETLTWTNPSTLMAMKIAADIDLYQHLQSHPRQATDLAAQTSTDPALLSRILRMLASMQIVDQDSPDTYSANDTSGAMASNKGPINSIKYFWPIGAARLADMPDYLRENGYRQPSDASMTPFNQIMGNSFWSYLAVHQDTRLHFDAVMTSMRAAQTPWTKIFDITSIMTAHDKSTVLCVDVGGGQGQDMTYLSQAVPPSCRIVLQDMASVLTPSLDLPANIELMVHDFFATQPVMGAKLYFMHAVCHDWPDREAEHILTNVQRAMTPGYSKLLLYETVMPLVNATPRMAAVDLVMMCHHAALERTEEQWKALLAKASLRWVNFFCIAGMHQGIIEVEVLD